MLKISTKDGDIELRRLEFDVRSGQTPDLNLRASVHFAGFSSSNKSLRTDGRSFQLFLRALREVETQRWGSAELQGMSPGDLKLEISIVDAAGHVDVKRQLERSVYVSPDQLVTPSVRPCFMLLNSLGGINGMLVIASAMANSAKMCFPRRGVRIHRINEMAGACDEYIASPKAQTIR